MNEFEELALNVAAESPCSKRKVGAVLTPAIPGEGNTFNASNYEVQGECCEYADGTTKPSVVHAEVAVCALLEEESKPFPSSTSWLLYVTHTPCLRCLAYIGSVEQRLNINIDIKVVEQFMKFDTDKLRYDLVPPSAIKALAEVLTYGAKKYKPNNWRNGEVDRYVAALYRHLEAWRDGEQIDEESGMRHLAHAITNIAFLLELTND